MMSFAEELKNMRLQCGMSQEGLAQQIGVVFGTITRWESGKAIPTMKRMELVLKFYDEQGFDRQAIFSEWKKEKQEQENGG